MRVRRAPVISACLALVGLAVGIPSAAADRGPQTYTFAVIGDIPYGPAQIARFPKVVDQINADKPVRLVTHLGDIKDGSSVCSDEYFAQVKTQFDRFADPLVYTVGDNEWTDCHRANNGSYNPLERLAKVRQVFFPQPGRTLGQHPAKVETQAAQGIPEDVRFTRDDVAFAALHIVGSNNSMAPWTGKTAPTPEQAAEVLNRTSAVMQSIHDTFAQARDEHNKAVVLLTQADMFDPTVTNPAFADYYAFQPIVQEIAREAANFRGPVYLFNGDSHVYNSDKPLAASSPWTKFYGVTTPAENLSRITVDGSTGDNDYLRVTIDSHNPAVLTWARVPFTS
ncbi:metallophosphoesterase [Kribbella pratensis]|uniref:Calcineurin-like phosphoesterase family protein n=1 Tax=Kribbella pratensis TaxID=2512112 RepID=A0A4R8C330_9ACTN|nr:metallophosphoesterase [Kribbella pratensis]TDW66205.1 calcineurin-like phosphoesterase family protein [Kribbella pratensis]